jgi:hypothetical protein
MINLLLTMFLACGDKEAEDTATEEVVEETDTAADPEDTAAELPEEETEESEESEEPAE